jgi:hypothetical protein
MSKGWRYNCGIDTPWAKENPKYDFMWHEKDNVIDLSFIFGIQFFGKTTWCSNMNSLKLLQ